MNAVGGIRRAHGVVVGEREALRVAEQFCAKGENELFTRETAEHREGKFEQLFEQGQEHDEDGHRGQRRRAPAIRSRGQ